MKIIIIGSSGMLGHVVSYYFIKKYNENIILCSRSKTNISTLHKNFVKIKDYSKKELFDLIEKNRPCKIINCTAVTNYKVKDKKLNLINSELPKLLSNIISSKNDGSQLIHISTNGVFSGKRGSYTESDQPDAINVYGKSKIAGEAINSKNIIIRTSIIGPELKNNVGLFEWFLKQKGEIKGYTKVKWNGVTTLECAKFIDWVIKENFTGLVHLFSNKISKFDLLNIINKMYEKNIKIKPDDTIKLDQTIATSRSDINYIVPNFKDMLQELKDFYFLK